MINILVVENNENSAWLLRIIFFREAATGSVL